jgi:hypothetical protein
MQEKKKMMMNKKKKMNDREKREEKKERMEPLLDLLIHTSAAAALRRTEQPNFLYGNMQKTNFFPLLLPLMFSRANNFKHLVHSNLNSVYIYI